MTVPLQVTAGSHVALSPLPAAWQTVVLGAGPRPQTPAALQVAMVQLAALP